ncbi:AAA family ATPase, partial [Subtercola boreus]
MTTPTTPQTASTTMTAATSASIYQQLKGHLAELKLADAAEALPRVLNQAQAEG